MTPRPIYRWKSLWFGVLVIVFLEWAWGRSMKYTDRCLWVSRHFNVAAENGGGRASLNCSDLFRPAARVTVFEAGEPELTFKGEHWFYEAVIWKTRHRQFHLILAHWFAILLSFVPWSGSLAWRWRRMGKLATLRG